MSGYVNPAAQHGTRTGYVHYGCRCSACRVANADECWEARERRRAALRRGDVSPPHGSTSTYDNYQCRCGPCRAAKAVANAAYTRRASASCDDCRAANDAIQRRAGGP